MADAASMYQLIVLVILVGVLAQIVSGLFRLPSIIFLLLFGVALGRYGLGVINPGLLGGGLNVIITLAVAIILFEGSLNLKLRHVKEVGTSVRRLITVGFAITFFGAGLAAHAVAGLTWELAALFGALVSVTGPTVIRPLVRRIRVRREIATILEGEGILADPIGAILAIICLELALQQSPTLGDALIEYAYRLGVGLGVGVVVGGFLAVFIRYQRGKGEGLKILIVLACALGCHAAAEMLRHESGLMAVVAAGLVAQLGVQPHERELREFKEQITTLLISILFILLAANLRIDAMLSEGWPGLATVLIVMFLIRPINVFYSTRGDKPNFREKIFLSWTAPRGIVAASVASLASLKLRENAQQISDAAIQAAQMAQAHRIEALIFMVVFLTVMAQGTTAGLLARMLGILAKETGRVLIVGANPLARKLATLYRDTGRDVVMMDTNPYHCQRAEREGLSALCGNVLDREALRLAGILDIETVVAVTGSVKVNELASQIVRNDYDLKNVYAALDSRERNQIDPMLERNGVRLAFGRPVPLQSWMGALEDGSAALRSEVATEAVSRPVRELTASPDGMIVALTRKGQLHIGLPDTRLEPGDLVHLLVRGGLAKAERALPALTK